MAPFALGAARRFRVPTGPTIPTGGAVFAAWGTSMGLLFLHDVVVTKDWPCPGRYIRASAAYLILALLARMAPRLAGTMAWGLTVALLVRQASIEVNQKGTFFGIKVR